MYSHFDYLQVLATLKQLSKDIERGPRTAGYRLAILTFEEENSGCIAALASLHDQKEFSNTPSFCLLYATLRIEGKESLTFVMGREISKMIFQRFLSQKDQETFEKIFPVNVVEHTGSDWTEIIAIFIGKMRIIFDNNLKFENK